MFLRPLKYGIQYVYALTMAPPSAYEWPESIRQDVAVLSLNPDRRFVFCRACQQHSLSKAARRLSL